MIKIPKILILDDEISSCEAVAEYLRQRGYALKSCLTIDDFRHSLQSFAPQFVIIDKYIQGVDSTFLIQELRSTEVLRTIPILMITGCEDDGEKINALKIGADAVLIKPIQLEMLTMKIHALFRRASSYQQKTEQLYYKSLKLSPLSGEVFLNEERLYFTETEFKLLQSLILEKGKPVRRESLAFNSLSSRNRSVRTIDVHINSIRNKLGEIGVNIKTLRGRGYMLLDENETSY